MIAINRNDWNELATELFHDTYGPETARTMERLYPMGTTEMICECLMRGVIASPGRIEYFAKLPTSNLRIIGKQRVWYPSDVDSLVAYLEAHKAHTNAAQNAIGLRQSLIESLDDTWNRVVWLRWIMQCLPKESPFWIPLSFEHIGCLSDLLSKQDLSLFYGGDAKAREMFTDDRRLILVSLVRADRDQGIPLPAFIRDEVYEQCRGCLDGKLPGVLPPNGKYEDNQ